MWNHSSHTGRSAGLALLPVSGRAVPPEATGQPLAPSFRARSSGLPAAIGKLPATPMMLSVTAAWRLLCARTGAGISRGTFYRWIREGKIVNIRLGRKMMIPAKLMDEIIVKCLNGEDVF